MVELCEPDAVHWCDGSDVEFEMLCKQLVDAGTFVELDADRRPGSYWAHSDPRTSPGSRTAPSSAPSARSTPGRPTTGRTRPRCGRRSTSCSGAACAAARCTSCRSAWGRSALPLSYIGVEITDSPYVAVEHAHDDARRPGRARRPRDRRRVRAVRRTRSARRSSPGEDDVPWPCNPDEKWIVHFPETREIWSFGSGYGGNASAGEEVLRAAHRVGDRARRGMARRAHARAEDHEPGGDGAVLRRRVPVGLRQDEPRDADPHRARLEGRDHRRRHRVDEVRTPTAACTPSTPSSGSSAWPRAPTTARTPTRCARSTATRCSPTPPSPTTATCGGRT